MTSQPCSKLFLNIDFNNAVLFILSLVRQVTLVFNVDQCHTSVQAHRN